MPFLSQLKRELMLAAACLGAFCSTLEAQVIALPWQLTIKPIFVANDTTTAVLTNFSSELPLFQEATQRLFAQAGIRVVWESQAVYTDPTFYTLDGTGFGGDVSLQMHTLVQDGISYDLRTHNQSLNPNTVNVFFTGANGAVLGVSGQSFNYHNFSPSFQNGATVSESVFSPEDYSLTTLAHEIGHVLGLNHDVISAVQPYSSGNNPYANGQDLAFGNLMYEFPLGANELTDIWNPFTSTGVGELTANQISLMRFNSPFIVTNSVGGDTYDYSAIPEPSTYALGSGLFAGLLVLRKKWKARSAH